jgi:hypothetical protein
MSALLKRPLPLLVAACLVQLGIGIVVAFASTHNHFVWYSGGDATEYWTSSWLIGHGALSQAFVGYGVPVLWAWLPPLTGASMLSALPVITVVQLVVFVPLCVVLVWSIGDLLFGRLYAWGAVVLWIAFPFLMLWGFRADYAPEFRDFFLAPHWYGLTMMADMPSLLAVLAATWATLRLAESRAPADALLSGALTGVALGIKPANGFFIPAVALLVASARSPRAVLVWCGGIVLPLATLALWKSKGRGSLPILAEGQSREAAGQHPVVAITNTYVHFNWTHFQSILSDLHEVFWSVRLLEFLVIAGLLGALRRSPVKGAFLGLWFVAFCIVKGSSDLVSIPALSYWRFIEPGIPALIFLAASVVFLIPRAGKAYAGARVPRALPGGRRTIGALLGLLVVVPFALMAVLPAANSIRYARDPALGNDAPLSAGLRIVGVAAAAGEVRLSWRSPGTASTRSYYVVYRSQSPETCSVPPEGAKVCDLTMKSIALTRAATFTDHPGPGAHTYRIGLLANFRDRDDGSDLILVGPARSAG